MEKKPVNLRKIPLQEFIDALVDIYNMGADFIDLLGVPDETQDIMSIVVRKEYIDQSRNQFSEEDENYIVNDFDASEFRDFSEDDFNDLTNIT